MLCTQSDTVPPDLKTITPGGLDLLESANVSIELIDEEWEKGQSETHCLDSSHHLVLSVVFQVMKNILSV
jgi:hypothetical protein